MSQPSRAAFSEKTPLGSSLGALLFALWLIAANPASAMLADGDFRVKVDTYSLPAASGQSILRLVVQVPAAELSWQAGADSLHARLRLSWGLHAMGENPVQTDEVELLAREAGQGVGGQSFLYVRECTLAPGQYRLEFRCRDEGGRTGGLTGLFGRHRESRLSELVELRAYGEAGTLVDPLFCSCPDEGVPRYGAVFSDDEALFGLRSVFVPGRGLAPESSRTFSLVLTIENADGETRFERKGGWRYQAEPVPLDFCLPLEDLEPGHYRLILQLGGEDLASQRFERAFRLLGGPGIGGEEAGRRAIEARLFLDGEDFRSWQQLAETDRVAMMLRFWRAQDPNPDTDENEVYDEFLRRYESAQQRFTVFQPGALSDRGRVLIRLGEPDEIKHEVMPMNRRDLINAIRDLHGKDELEPGVALQAVDPAEGGDDEAADADLDRELSRIGLGNSVSFGNESEPFEVWSYQLAGRPLLFKDRLRLKNVGLKLIFADRGGYGDYELVYRSEDFDF